MSESAQFPEITHLNCGWLHAPPSPPACCHCLLVKQDDKLLLVDTGIGMQDIASPVERIGRAAIDAAGFQFLPEVTAIKQIEAHDYQANDVTDIVLTHVDHDHVGGLADFPHATVHLSLEELNNLESGNPRYGQAQFSHGPKWQTYDASQQEDWFDLPSRPVATALDIDIRLVPLFGHTLGQCGVAIRTESGWMLHVGDTYYLRGELSDSNHPVSKLAEVRADDNEQRLASLDLLRNLIRHEEITCCGYHDVTELPESVPTFRM
ncbi:MBL fold metallo-hydrolase [Calycomorphotria hydatis]|uniref:Metallo-beta-lactamase superfamily protein n=1 Tax=Calycomorphotria hydatis TaxID=2528027 RepID=A0A517T6W4_9PLAN|nr:MBL fold metallo-hydrolase [Calycomorphotria hydatis]QDT64111.1 Metallo-beta-lactamase superfamily protein [Calycomorphotria hydatis]